MTLEGMSVSMRFAELLLDEMCLFLKESDRAQVSEGEIDCECWATRR